MNTFIDIDVGRIKRVDFLEKLLVFGQSSHKLKIQTFLIASFLPPPLPPPMDDTVLGA